MEHTIFLTKLLYNNELSHGQTSSQTDSFNQMHGIVKDHLVRLTQNSGIPSNFPLEDVRKKLLPEPPAITKIDLGNFAKFHGKESEDKAKTQEGLQMSNNSK